MIDYETTELETPFGIWQIRVGVGICSIVDPQGRERFWGESYAVTATHLAMELAKRTYQSTPAMDKALKNRAEDAFQE